MNTDEFRDLLQREPTHDWTNNPRLQPENIRTAARRRAFIARATVAAATVALVAVAAFTIPAIRPDASKQFAPAATPDPGATIGLHVTLTAPNNQQRTITLTAHIYGQVPDPEPTMSLAYNLGILGSRIYWGDGTMSADGTGSGCRSGLPISAQDLTFPTHHTYRAAGIYKISFLTGFCPADGSPSDFVSQAASPPPFTNDPAHGAVALTMDVTIP